MAKESFGHIADYGKGVENIKSIAYGLSDINEFEKKAAALGMANSKSLNVKREDVKEFKIGFFKGYQIYLNDGSVIKIRTGNWGR